MNGPRLRLASTVGGGARGQVEGTGRSVRPARGLNRAEWEPGVSATRFDASLQDGH